MVASLSIAGCTSSTNSNKTVSSTAQSASSTATTTPITRATQTATNSLVADGYTITSNFKSTGTGFDAYPMYSGEMTKDGMNYSASILQADNQSNAMTIFAKTVSNIGGDGFSGNYTTPTQWTGTQSINGATLHASVIVTDGNALILIFPE